jgi:RND family efflux transporter MFP subunit
MLPLPKVTAAAATVLVALAASAFAQTQQPAVTPRPAASRGQTVVVAGSLDWLARSDISAKQEGIIDSIEFDIGARVQEGDVIGHLDDAIATLNVDKQRLIAEGQGPILKVTAQREQALSKLARLERLDSLRRGTVSREELDQARADVNYADGLIKEAKEKQAVDKAELALAEKILEHHQIVAPFTGIIIERLKQPSESVRQNEAVIRMGKTDKFRFVGWIPLEQAQRIRVGDLVEFRPSVEGSDLPIESVTYQGRVTAAPPEVAAQGVAEARVLAEIINPPNPDHPELELYANMRGELTIHLGSTPPAVASDVHPVTGSVR